MFKMNPNPKPSADLVKPQTPAQILRAKEVELELASLEEEKRSNALRLQFEREQEEFERNRWREQAQETVKAKRSREWTGVVQAWTGRFVPFMPLVLVNTMAVFGQLGWGRHNLTQVGSGENDPIRWIMAALFAATLESIALFLAYYANRALDRGDSATALYLGAFGVAAVVAGVNYSHYASTGKVTLLAWDIPGPTAMAVVFAMCSLASPWLWRIKHRDANRDKLHSLGMIDAKAVRLSMASKVFYPIRSFQVIRDAVWARETNPIKAVENWETKVAIKRARAEARQESKAAKATQEAPSFTETAAEVVPALETPAEAPKALEAPPVLPKIAQKYPEAWRVYVASDQGGNALSQRALARNHMRNNRHHAAEMILEWRKIKYANGSSGTTP